MKVKCPACGAAMSLDALIGHDEARAALVAVSGISDELVRGCLLRSISAPRHLRWERMQKPLCRNGCKRVNMLFRNIG